MAFLNLTEETWLDLTVNLIPLAILLVLDALFWIVNPWGWDPFYVLMAHFLTLFPLLLLALLTYVSGVLVQRDEHRAELAASQPSEDRTDVAGAPPETDIGKEQSPTEPAAEVDTADREASDEEGAGAR